MRETQNVASLQKPRLQLCHYFFFKHRLVGTRNDGSLEHSFNYSRETLTVQQGFRQSERCHPLILSTGHGTGITCRVYFPEHDISYGYDAEGHQGIDSGGWADDDKLGEEGKNDIEKYACKYPLF
jgi:hypothetical protein